VFNLIQSDIGRPISDITSKVIYKDITKDSKKVLDTLTVKEEEIQTLEGEWLNMRIMPYRTVDNVIDGIVITFVDVTESRKIKNEISKARQFAESIVDTIREPLLVLDSQLRVVSASRSFYRTFHALPEETEHRHIYDLGNREWDIPALRNLLEKILPEKNVFQDYIVEYDFPAVGKKKMMLNARKLYKEEEEMILLAIEDITGWSYEKK
jgi:PAS domain-containing protein